MQQFTKLTGRAAFMNRANVDTDQIIPKQFLKRIERSGFGQFLFFDWRFHDDGSERADFELNQPQYRNASILVTRRNFGCGSSREHAPWALGDYGFRAIIAPTFADIFFNNCFKNGILPITLSEAQVEDLFRRGSEQQDYTLTIDLESCTISDPKGLRLSFAVEPFRRECLLKGLDDIGLTLAHLDEIAAFEKRRGLSAVST